MPQTGFSMVRSYRRCPKQYEYKYIRALQRKKPAPPLIRGSILHEMLDARALNKPAKKVLATYEEKYSGLFREEQETYGEDFLGDIRKIYDGYLRRYGADEGIEWLASEEFVAVDLSKTLRYTGHLDKRLRTQKDGRHWIMDHKTHKNIPTEEHRYSDYQILLYAWAYNQTHPSTPVDGVVWDYIRTKAPRVPEPLKKGGLSQAVNQDTDYATYTRTLAQLKIDPAPYAEFLEGLKKRSETKFYQRIFLPLPPKAMVESVVKDFRETSTIMHGLKVYPRTMTRDCSWCEYYRLCNSELRGLDAAFIQKTEYEVKAIGDQNIEED